MLGYSKLDMVGRDKHSSLLGPFVSYEENKVLWPWLPAQLSQHFIFFENYEWAQYARELGYAKWRGLAGKNTVAYWVHLKVMKKMKCCEYDSWEHKHNRSASW